MPSRQPTLPELQSVSQPRGVDDHQRLLEVVVAVEQRKDMISAWLGTMWQLPPYLS